MDAYSSALFNSICDDLRPYLQTIPLSTYVSNNNIDPWAGMSISQSCALSLRNSIVKKYEAQTDQGDAQALQLFKENNSFCESFKLKCSSELEALVVNDVKHRFYTMLDGVSDLCPSLSLIAQGFGVGAGKSTLVDGKTFYEKVASGNLTTTSEGLYRLYTIALGSSLWASTENTRAELFGKPLGVSGSKLSFVPKTEQISRVICTEPSLNMLFQKGLSNIFLSCLQRFYHIDMTTQPKKNQNLAQLGSIDNTCCTLDLSSASDRISLSLIGDVCPTELVSWLNFCRSPVTLLPDGSSEKLYMLSTMGNGFTSSFQTLLFATINKACHHVLGVKTNAQNFGVFGDDIICDRRVYSLLSHMLTTFGFVVSVNKSFADGSFRESCGADFFCGTNVRGVYCKSLRTMQDRISLINRLVRWSAVNGIWLTNTIDYLLSIVPRKFLLRVPPYESDIAGVHMPLAIAKPLYKRTYSESRGDLGPFCYSYYDSSKHTLKVELFDSLCPDQSASGLRCNPSGIYLAAIGGYLRDGVLSFRPESIRFNTRLKLTHCWDYNNLALDRFDQGGWHRWKMMSEVYFWSISTH